LINYDLLVLAIQKNARCGIFYRNPVLDVVIWINYVAKCRKIALICYWPEINSFLGLGLRVLYKL
jgi:hypothetical protein